MSRAGDAAKSYRAAMHRTCVLAALTVTVACLAAQTPDGAFDPAAAIDAYVDARFDGPAGATAKLLDDLAKAGIRDVAAIEALLRAPRHAYPDVSDCLGKATEHPITCYHVDYASNYLLYVPATYRSDHPAPLVVVGHGGNSSMSPERARSVAASYLQAYAGTFAKDLGALVVAPESGRGWGHIGNSLILSTISDLQRRFCIDPDRVYVTGQSMGGHMSFRAALSLGDRFAAVSPQSGGYDYVKTGAIANLLAVPGYVTWGATEPYGIDRDNRTNAAWSEAHGLDWVWVEKDGGHEIYADELPKIAKFFAAHPRDPYHPLVHFSQGGDMKFTRTWEIEGWPQHTVYSDTHPLRWNQSHWIEVAPRPDEKEPLRVLAKNLGANHIDVTCDKVRELTVRLHPRMVDFAQPVRITVNGETAFDAKVAPDAAAMLELVREFDDRGRIYPAQVHLHVTTDRAVEVPVPAGK